jgi:hypothetical protein
MIDDDMKENLMEIYSANKAMERNLDEQDIKGPYRGIWEAGFEDPNVVLNPKDLHGTPYELGVFYEMRQADPIIASTMDFRRDSVAALEYDVIPRSANPTVEEDLAAKAVKYTLENLPGSSLNDFIARTYDMVYSYGFALYEMHIPQEGENKGRFQLLEIPSFYIEWWNLDDETRSKMESAYVNLGDKYETIKAEKLVWFGNQLFLGNYWGLSDLRKLLAVFSAKKQDLQMYLALRRLQSGILYFKENGDYPNNASSWSVAKNYLMQYFKGQPSPLILNAGMDLEFLNAQIPSLDGYSTTAAYFDGLMRQALGDSLKNLGISHNGGSLALGKEMAVTDAEQFRNHVEQYLMILNGAGAPEANLLEIITEMLGFSRSAAPKIVAVDNTATDMTENMESLLVLFKEGLITREDLPDGFAQQVLDRLGFIDKESEEQGEG